jgi:hypothetical protein
VQRTITSMITYVETDISVVTTGPDHPSAAVSVLENNPLIDSEHRVDTTVYVFLVGALLLPLQD